MGEAACTPFVSLAWALRKIRLEKPPTLTNQPVVMQRHHDRNPTPFCLLNASGGKVHKMMKVNDVGSTSIEKFAEAPSNLCIAVAPRKAIQVAEGIIHSRDRKAIAGYGVHGVLGLCRVSDSGKDLNLVATQR